MSIDLWGQAVVNMASELISYYPDERAKQKLIELQNSLNNVHTDEELEELSLVVDEIIEIVDEELEPSTDEEEKDELTGTTRYLGDVKQSGENFSYTNQLPNDTDNTNKQ